MSEDCAPLRILLSREAMGRLEVQLREVVGARGCELIAFDDPRAPLAEVAFVSREVTGLSTKHEVLPATRQAYDALLGARGLQWVHIHSAGADRPVYQELLRRGVEVSTSSGANAPVVAQTALLGLLALARHWPRLMAAQREQRWAPLIASGLPRDLQGQTAVVVGWGPVGRELARLLQAVGLKVLVVRRTESDDPSHHTRLHDLLPAADWLLLACPLTVETRGLVGAEELALLPAHAGLVNVSRGEVVDEAALIDALRTRRIAGAYLDVFEHEPLPQDSPLWTLPNVIVTPHSAGFSDGNEQRVAAMFLDRLRSRLGG